MDLGMPTLLEAQSLTACAALCWELGLQFVELNMNLPQYQISQLRPASLKAAAEEYGIYYTIHLDENLNISDFNPYVAEAYTRTVMETIDLAKELKIPILNMHLSKGVYFAMPAEKVFLFDAYRDLYLASIRAFRDKCEAAVGKGDVKICLENCDGYKDFHIQALDILLESPVFALTYDIGHNYVAGGTDEDIILCREKKLVHFHFHDAKGSKPHLPLGTGEIDLEKYLCLAASHNCRIVLETKTVEGLRQSVQQFRHLAV